MIERCKNNHIRTIENTGFQKNGAGKITKRCMDCYEENRAHRNVLRAAQARERRAKQREKLRQDAAPPKADGRGPRLQDNGQLVRYEYEHWISGRTFFIKVTAIEYERATEEGVHLAARRRTQRELAARGYDTDLAKGIGALVEWDRSRNWADQLTESITYQLTRALPKVDEDASAA